MRGAALAAAALAATSATADAGAGDIVLSDRMTERFARVAAGLPPQSPLSTVDRFADHLVADFSEIATELQVAVADLPEMVTREVAARRAERLAHYLQADLNWDGLVETAELRVFTDRAEEPGNLERMMAIEDVDGDGRLTLLEMWEQAGAQVNDAGLRAHYAEIATWDLNRDGILTFFEITDVVAAHSPVPLAPAR